MKRDLAIAGDGPEQNPDVELLDSFWQQAINAVPEIARDHQVRSIGIDEATTDLIIEFIKAGEKTGTYSLPWLMEAEGHPKTTPDTPIMLVSYAGIPRVVVQITSVYETTFGNISLKDTALDGPPVRDLDIWIPLHTKYWNGLLSRHNRVCTPDMPVLVERFKFVYATK